MASSDPVDLFDSSPSAVLPPAPDPTVSLMRLYSFLVVLAVGATPAIAQRTSHSNFNSWYILGAEVQLNEKWAASLDIQERRSGPLEQPQAFFFRPSVNYALAKGVKLGLGASRSESYPYGEVPSAYQTPEWRIFEQIQLAQSIERIGLTHRYRLEQRWLGRRGADTSDHRIATWQQQGRARYMAKGILPFHGQTPAVGDGYFMVYDEVMINFGRNVTGNVFDQNRAAGAIGWRFSREWKTEVGYLQQTLLKPNGKDLEQNATLTFGAYFTK